MSHAWAVHGATDTGRERTRNEDAYLTRPYEDGSWLWVVCDGMGGHDAGDIASRTATRALDAYVSHHQHERDVPSVLHHALIDAGHAVLETARGGDMGTTAVVAHARGPSLWYGWVGDSRLYVFRQGAIVERSQDHTRVGELVAEGALTPEQARHHPEAHVLTRALGAGEEVPRPTVYGEPLSVEPGDVVLICSDGLHDLVDGAELYTCIEGLSPSQATATLIDTANARGGHDNITVVVAVWGADTVPRRAAPPPPPRSRRQTHPDLPPEPAPSPRSAARPGARPVVPTREPEPPAPSSAATPPRPSAAADVPPQAAPTDRRGVPLPWVLLGLGVAFLLGAALVLVGMAIRGAPAPAPAPVPMAPITAPEPGSPEAAPAPETDAAPEPDADEGAEADADADAEADAEPAEVPP